MRIKYAVSTMVFWGCEHPLSFEQECQFLKSLGLGMELMPTIKGYDQCRYERRNWPRLAEATRDMLVVMRSRNDGPTLEQWQEQIECARLLGASIVADLLSLRIPQGAQTDGCDFAAEVVNLARTNNVRLCLETGPLPTVRRVGEKFESLWYCLDTGYANIDPACSFRQYVNELAGKIAHLHLTDNYGRSDDHEAPGLRGGIPRDDWNYLLEALNRYDNDVVGSFEMGPCMPDVMIRKAGEFLFDELNWPGRPQNGLEYKNLVYNPA